MPQEPPPLRTTHAPDVAALDAGARADAGETPVSGGALLRRAHAALRTAGRATPTAALVGGVFGVDVAEPAAATPWVAMLDGLLKRSPLFVADRRGGWSLAEWDLGRRRLADIEWAVLDVETTGLAPTRHRIIEVGAVIVRGGEPAATYQRLVNPERRIPQFITSFTGIRQTMVNRARPASVVLPEFRAFLGERVVVGHNVGFDLSFLNCEAERLGTRLGFPDEGMDTIAMARRYVTGMRRASLDRVAAALHVPFRQRHRALGDAQVTARVFALLLARALADGCETLDDLRAALAETSAASVSSPTPRPTGNMYLNPAWRRDFPALPGVYLMKDAGGQVIYVGKAKSLKDRLASYYNQPLGYVRKLDGLLQSIKQIEIRVLGSELEALLTESRLIKELQPQYNVQLRNYEQYPFIKVDVQHPFPRIYATREVAADGARYFGPFRSGRIVNATIELIHRVFPVRTCTRSLPPLAPPSEPCLRYHLKRCPAPCRGDVAGAARERYAAAVEEVCSFLGGERADLIDRLRREMFAASARQDFERAARLRDALKDADQVLLGQRLVSGAVDANNLLIVYPSSEAEHVEIFLVRHGRLIDQRRVAALDDALRADVGELAGRAAALGRPPDRVGKAEVDQINIIARWVHRHSEDDQRNFFYLPTSLAESAVIQRFAAEVAEAVLLARVEAEGDAPRVDGDPDNGEPAE
ncbi:MAG TPA: exonuclease domain-containing protein [Ktedonobacterales bacterium]